MIGGTFKDMALETRKVDGEFVGNTNFELWVLLRHTTDALARAREKELRKSGISRIQAAVLFILDTLTPPVIPAAISRRLVRKAHTTSELLNRMVKKGLIKKVKDLERKNQVRVVMTEKGQEAYRDSREMAVVSRTLSCLSLSEREEFRSYLTRLRDKALEELGAEYLLPFGE